MGEFRYVDPGQFFLSQIGFPQNATALESHLVDLKTTVLMTLIDALEGTVFPHGGLVPGGGEGEQHHFPFKGSETDFLALQIGDAQFGGSGTFGLVDEFEQLCSAFVLFYSQDHVVELTNRSEEHTSELQSRPHI